MLEKSASVRSRLESETRKVGIRRVDNDQITTIKDYEADVSIVSPSYLTKAYCLKRQLRWEVGGK